IPLLAFATVLPLAAAAPPTVGEKARDFTLSTPDGRHMRLSDVMSQGPVVLVVLRGYPGYQCPYCNRQVQDFIQKAQGFVAAGAPLPPRYWTLYQNASPHNKCARIAGSALGVSSRPR